MRLRGCHGLSFTKAVPVPEKASGLVRSYGTPGLDAALRGLADSWILDV